MRTRFIRAALLPALLIGTAMLGGCIIAPYPYGYYRPHPFYWWR